MILVTVIDTEQKALKLSTFFLLGAEQLLCRIMSCRLLLLPLPSPPPPSHYARYTVMYSVWGLSTTMGVIISEDF